MQGQHILDPSWLWQELTRLTQLRICDEAVVFIPHSPVTDRFHDVVIPRHSALIIDNKIFNANRLCLREDDRIFIAAQYPQEPQKDPSARELFWRSAFQHGSIIDLTQLSEPGITPYYPTAEGQPIVYGSMHIVCQTITQRSADLYESLYFVTDYEQDPRQHKEVKRFHYFDWRDHAQASLPMLCNLINILENQPFEQTCIHCRAGVGRTGTLITAYYLKKQIERGDVTYLNLGEVLISLVCDLRMQRGPLFVQKPTQLNQLLEYGRLILKTLEDQTS